MGRRSRAAALFSALVIGAFQVVGTLGAADNQPERKDVDALAIVLVLLGPAALARRDRWPLAAVAVSAAAADVYIASGYPYGPVFVSVVVALFDAVQAGHRRPTWLLAGAAYAGIVIAQYADSRVDGPNAVHLGLVAGWLVVVLAVADVVRTRRDQAAERRRVEQDAQRLGLAQELHDVLAHNISMINVQASVALHLLDDDPAQARPALASIKEASRESLHELRTALDVLRRGEAAPRSPAPRLADLDALVAGVRAGGLAVDVDRPDPLPPLPAAVELAAFRVVQEALTNTTRHARAATGASVRLDHDPGAGVLTVEVADDGRGPRAQVVVPGNGLRGMRERAESLGGTLDAGPGPGGGFRVVARLPLR